MSGRRQAGVAAFCALVLLGGAGCKRGPREIKSRPGQTWNVYHGKKKVLVARNAPGPLVSTAMLPPGVPLPQHPFLTASALYPPDEGRMRVALEQATGFDDFLRRVQADGFTVEPEE